MPPSDRRAPQVVRVLFKCYAAFVLYVALSETHTAVRKVTKPAFIARISNEIGSSQPDVFESAEWKRMSGHEALEHVVAAFKASSEIVDGHLMKGLCVIGELAVRLQSHHAEQEHNNANVHCTVPFIEPDAVSARVEVMKVNILNLALIAPHQEAPPLKSTLSTPEGVQR